MVASVAVNELIIRNLRSIQRIEASNRAYMAAEAGVEDALYELTPHFAGYQTPDLTDPNVRKADFEGKTKCDQGDYCNNWTIRSRSGKNTWEGKLYANKKITLALYNDTQTPATVPKINEINHDTTGVADITPFNVANFSITFSIPSDVTSVMPNGLAIDNDEDGLLNEDPIGIPSPITNPANPEDDDKDGEVDEDGDEDAVVLWKLTDGGSLSLTPKKGCLSSSGSSQGSDPCEKGFSSSINSLSPSPNQTHSITLLATSTGINEVGGEETIADFINRAINGSTSAPVTTGNLNAKIQFEFLIIAPMEHMDITSSKKYSIPYIKYEVDSSVTNQLPYPQFTIKSDGYYRGFKQSITSTITPKTTVPLFDFTIIQQE